MVLYQDKSKSIPNKYGPNIPDKRGREDKTDILRVRKGQEKGGLEAFVPQVFWNRRKEGTPMF